MKHLNALVLIAIFVFLHTFQSHAVLPKNYIKEKLNHKYAKAQTVTRALIRYDNEARVFAKEDISLQNNNGKWEVHVNWEEGKKATKSNSGSISPSNTLGESVQRVVIHKMYKEIELDEEDIVYHNFPNTQTKISFRGILNWSVQKTASYKSPAAVLELRTGVVDSKGKFVVQPEWTDVDMFEDDYFRVSKYNKSGLYSPEGKEVLPPEFTKIELDDKGDFRVSDYNKIGIYNQEGKRVVPVKYTELKHANGGYQVSDYNKMGFLNAKGEEVIPVKYTKIETFKNGVAKAWIYNKCGYISEDGNVIIPAEYTKMERHGSDLIKAWDYNKCGIITTTGEEVIPVKYTKLIQLDSGNFEAWDYTKMGIIDENGKEIIPVRFTKIKKRDADLLQVWEYTKTGLIKNDGTTVIPLKFTYIGEFKNGKAEARVHNTKFTITKDGQILN